MSSLADNVTVIEELVWFWFYYALWLASVFTLVLVLRQSSENRSITKGVMKTPKSEVRSRKLEVGRPSSALEGERNQNNSHFRKTLKCIQNLRENNTEALVISKRP